ncbi:MAG: HlyD family efflux transporter periplasmic adaptor subunit [Trebonia sp.]
MKFRPAALRQLEAPEQLDEVVRLASAPIWLMAAALAVIVAAIAAWASVGTVATTMDAPGLLIHADGVSTLDATVSGQVSGLWVPADGFAVAGTPLYSVQRADGQVRTVDLPRDAYVVSTAVTVGQLVEPGTPVASLELVSSASDPLEAVVFLPASRALAVRQGSPATLTVAAVPAPIFGTLSGTVTSVGAFPETVSSLQAFLGDGTDTRTYLAAGSVVRVVIRLDTAPGAPGALRWSKTTPGFHVNSESSVRASFVLAKQHPINWLLGQ